VEASSKNNREAISPSAQNMTVVSASGSDMKGEMEKIDELGGVSRCRTVSLCVVLSG
jgi:hypothetical protein